MTKTEKMLLFLRLLKTHRDGLSAKELKIMLQCADSAFYSYLKLLRRMSFNIKCRLDGKYILTLDEKSERMLIDYFPDLLVKPDREKFSLKNGFEIIYSQIYSVTEKKTGKIHYFREVPGICAQFPELSKFMIYQNWLGNTNGYETSKFIINKGPLMGYNDK